VYIADHNQAVDPSTEGTAVITEDVSTVKVKISGF